MSTRTLWRRLRRRRRIRVVPAVLRRAARRVIPSRWCGRVRGVVHSPEMLMTSSGHRRIARVGRSCGPERGIGRWDWSCAHVLACSACGRELRLFPADICPNRPASYDNYDRHRDARGRR